MRKLLSIIVVAAFLGGCQYAGKLAEFSTIGIDNPISIQDLAGIEASYLTVLRPSVTYLESRTCRNGEAELPTWITASPCGNYARKIVVQNTLRLAQQYRRQLSTFVKQNRTIDARVAYNELIKAISTMSDVPRKAGS